MCRVAAYPHCVLAATVRVTGSVRVVLRTAVELAASAAAASDEDERDRQQCVVRTNIRGIAHSRPDKRGGPGRGQPDGGSLSERSWQAFRMHDDAI